jgi:hypothetical protein
VDVYGFVLREHLLEFGKFPHLLELSSTLHFSLLKTEVEHVPTNIQCALQSEALPTVGLEFVFENFEHCLTPFSAH